MTTPLRYLLDTNVISETRKRQADAGVLAFIAATHPSGIYISVLTLGELRKGVARKRQSDPAAADSLAAWVEGIELSFADRILGIDAPTARTWCELSAERPRPVVDTLLAATASRHKMTLVTRNLVDIEGIDIKVLNPFAS